ncbi:MAG: hypothetical protein PHQ36_08285 [Anaerolineales bacterium]|nr:hypothetical protein [Anaerolineales bacterium]
MTSSSRILKWSLFAGALYFFSISVVHMLGIKVPILFIYFNVPSHAYQDRIISFLAFGWAVFLFTAFTDPQKQSALVRAILIAGAGALIGLSVNNAATDFQSLGADINANIFWAETAGVFVYWLWLVVFYFRSNK